MQDTLPILCKNCDNYLQELLPRTGKPTTDDRGARNHWQIPQTKHPHGIIATAKTSPDACIRKKNLKDICLITTTHPMLKANSKEMSFTHGRCINPSSAWEGEGVYTPIDIFLDLIPVIPADL